MLEGRLLPTNQRHARLIQRSLSGASADEATGPSLRPPLCVQSELGEITVLACDGKWWTKERETKARSIRRAASLAYLLKTLKTALGIARTA
jgi:hypothetical protein